jgi:alpha-1,2-mannosyltransferase
MTAVVWLTWSAVHRPPSDRQADLQVYLGAIDTVTHGDPLYSYAAANGDPFTYPPFALLALFPAGWAPVEVVRVVWTLATCVSALGLAWLLARGLGRPRWPLVLASASLLLMSAPLQSGLRFGQVSVFLVVLAFADAAGLVPDRWRGVAIGLTGAIKLTPLLFVPYLLVIGERRAALRATGVFAGAAVVAAVVLPRDSAVFWTHAVFTTSRVGDLSLLGNQSVNGMLTRIPVTTSARDLALALVVTVAVVAALYRARVLYRRDRMVEAAITCGCATLVASPVSWNHHQVWTVLAGLVLFTRGAVHRALAVLVVVVMCVRLPHPGQDAVAGFVADNARGLAALGVCCLGLVSAWRAVQTPRLVLFGRIAVRPRAMAAVGASGLLTAGFLVVTHLVHVSFPTLDARTVVESFGITYDDSGRVVPSMPEVYDTEVNYGYEVLPDDVVRVIGVAGKHVTKLVLSTSVNGPSYQVPIVDGQVAGLRVFVFEIDHPEGAQLDTYTFGGRLGCRCGDKLNS